MFGMFGRRTSFGKKTPSPPPPPPANLSPSDQKIDDALDAAIRLITQALDQAEHDCGKLAIHGPVPADVGKLLSDCVIYQKEKGNGFQYRCLGLTSDFKTFSYQPHCRLFMILNSVLLLERTISPDLRGQTAISQTPRPLVDAHMMRRWLRCLGPFGQVVGSGDPNALRAVKDLIRREVAEVAQSAPSWISQRVNLNDCVNEWASGYPGVWVHPLSPDVKRINGLPMTHFVHGLLIEFMVEAQVQGVRERWMSSQGK